MDGVLMEDGGASEGARTSLHFIWVVDCSGSMTGDRIASLNYAVHSAVPALRAAAADHPDCDLKVRVLSYADEPTWVVNPAVPIAQFDWQDLQAGGESNLGAALRRLASELTPEAMPGPQLPPVLVLLSDGLPTDDADEAIRQMSETHFGAMAIRIAIAIGADADMPTLQSFIGPSAIRPLRANSAETLINHIRWAAASLLKASSAAALNASDAHGQLAAGAASQLAVGEDIVW